MALYAGSDGAGKHGACLILSPLLRASERLSAASEGCYNRLVEQDPKPSTADLNDAFRKTCNPFLTPGATCLPDLEGLIGAVRDFDDFTPDNDPYGEHDFGALDWRGERIFWKIDYYDQSLTYGEDPLSPECQPVLTVMSGDEY